MGLFDFIFGTASAHKNNQCKKSDSLSPYGSLSDQEYFEDLYDGAYSGDEEAIQEMKDEFGEDWQ